MLKIEKIIRDAVEAVEAGRLPPEVTEAYYWRQAYSRIVSHSRVALDEVPSKEVTPMHMYLAYGLAHISQEYRDFFKEGPAVSRGWICFVHAVCQSGGSYHEYGRTIGVPATSVQQRLLSRNPVMKVTNRPFYERLIAESTPLPWEGTANEVPAPQEQAPEAAVSDEMVDKLLVSTFTAALRAAELFQAHASGLSIAEVRARVVSLLERDHFHSFMRCQNFLAAINDPTSKAFREEFSK